jgi:protein TorT
MAVAVGLTGAASAQDGWPMYEVNDGKLSEVVIPAQQAPSKKWKICVLLPHLKDSYWVGVNYGIVEELRRVGASATIHQAGGYDQLPKQIAQYDDCMAAKPDAIVVGAISEVGLTAKMNESMEKGIPTISVINPIRDVKVTSKIFVDFEQKGFATASFLVDKLGDAKGSVGAFPGPQGSGWAESYLEGFKRAFEGKAATMAEPKFGDSGQMVQLRLVEDTLQSYPDLIGMWGHPTASEPAVGALEEAGLNIPIVSHSENTEIIDLLRKGKVQAVGTEGPVIQARVAVNLAIAALEGQEVHPYYAPVPTILTPENLDQFDLTQTLAPQGYQPVYVVE